MNPMTIQKQISSSCHSVLKGGKSKCRKSLQKECTDDCRCCGLLDANPRRKTRAALPKRKEEESHSTAEAFLKEPIEMQRLLLQQVLMQMDTTISVVQMEQILEKGGSDKAQLTLDLPNGWKFKKRYEECSFEKDVKSRSKYRICIGKTGRYLNSSKRR